MDFTRLRTFKGHTDVVNSLDISYATMAGKDMDMPSVPSIGLDCDMLASGSNDGTVKVWDFRERRFSASFTVGY